MGDAPDLRRDPLGWLGRAAGYGGGEEWWEHTVEQRQDGVELFAAIAEAMAAVRTEAPLLSNPFKTRRGGRAEPVAWFSPRRPVVARGRNRLLVGARH